jgi:hypothetical protein
MGLLDDLKSEAGKLQDQQSSEEIQREKLEAIYREEINPKMMMISNYFSELADQLNILKPDTKVAYYIPGYQEVNGLVQQDYAINADSLENIKKLRLRFNAILPNEKEFSVTPKSKAAETRNFFEKQNITFAEWPVRDAHQDVIGLNFQLKLKVEILFMFEAKIETSSIQLSIVNFEDFGVKQKSYRPDAIDDKWLEEVGSYILRKTKTMHSLEISDDVKKKLRDQLKKAEGDRQTELEEMEEARRVQEALDKEKNENRFIKMLKKKIKGE